MTPCERVGWCGEFEVLVWQGRCEMGAEFGGVRPVEFASSRVVVGWGVEEVQVGLAWKAGGMWDWLGGGEAE
jgi:hypothetical protein